MTNLKPGDKCFITKSTSGDEGKIVVVIDYFVGGTWYDNLLWSENCDVVVETLGSLLHSRVERSGIVGTHKVRPYPSKWLRKLPEVKEDQKELVTEEV